MLIINSILNADVFNLFLGNGFGSWEELNLRTGLEYPHFDLLLFAFESGILGSILYVTLILGFALRLKGSITSIYCLICGLHLNLVNYPGIFLASFILSGPSLFQNQISESKH